MASPVAGSHSNGSMEYPDAAKRDVKNHLLFEVSTEAANRGNDHPAHSPSPTSLIVLESVGFTLSSGQKPQ